MGTLARRYRPCRPDAICYGMGGNYGCWELECCHVGEYRSDGCIISNEIAIFRWSLWEWGSESKCEGKEEITRHQGIAAYSLPFRHSYSDVRSSWTHKEVRADSIQISLHWKHRRTYLHGDRKTRNANHLRGVQV